MRREEVREETEDENMSKDICMNLSECIPYLPHLLYKILPQGLHTINRKLKKKISFPFCCVDIPATFMTQVTDGFWLTLSVKPDCLNTYLFKTLVCFSASTNSSIRYQ